jgi:hypothetical protein
VLVFIHEDIQRNVPNEYNGLGQLLFEQRSLLTTDYRRECKVQCTLTVSLASLLTKTVKRLQSNYDVTSIAYIIDPKTGDVQIYSI